MGAIGLLRGNALTVLVMLVVGILIVAAVREVSDAGVRHWVAGRLPQFDEQLEICKLAREIPDDLARGLCQSTVHRFMRQLTLRRSIGDAAILSAAAFVTVILYLWTSARTASRSTAPPARMAAAAIRRETLYAGLAATAILLAPALLFHIVTIAHGLFDGLWAMRLSYAPQHATLRGSLSTAWFVIAAPFVLPAVPLALASDRDSSLAEAARLGWSRYLEFAALAAATAGPFIGLAVLANWSNRLDVTRFLARRLSLSSHISESILDALATTFALAAVVAVAAAFAVAVAPRTQDAR